MLLGGLSMRVVRTEMYFDPREINWPLPELVTNTPGIAAAYFQIDAELGPDDVRGQLSWLFLHPEYNERTIRLFLDASLWGSGSLFPEPRQEGEEFNPTIINYILEQSIIIEQSPPLGVPFEQLLKGASVTSIGTLLGYYGMNEPLLFLTIPAGILVVGSAVAISKAMEKGLSHTISRLAGTRTPRKPTRR
jgi:hypothetical protein